MQQEKGTSIFENRLNIASHHNIITMTNHNTPRRRPQIISTSIVDIIQSPTLNNAD
jgi:predicted metal-dependent TIM-barrel fold hydrolase